MLHGASADCVTICESPMAKLQTESNARAARVRDLEHLLANSMWVHRTSGLPYGKQPINQQQVSLNMAETISVAITETK